MSNDHVDPEKQYFHEQEQEKLQRLKKQADQEAEEAERVRLKELHYLRCGKCGTKMGTEPFKGIEIEICGSCGAVLLDPGELEELVGTDESGVLVTLADLFRFTKGNG